MTEPTATPAAADPATPAAAPVTPPADPAATPTAPVKASIIPDDPGSAPPDPAPAAAPKADDGPEWFYADGVKGQGKMPEWYRADKYKTLADQAEAYHHLDKRFGAFAGAPKDGKYEMPPPPEGFDGEFDVENPLLQTFTGWAKDNQVSQKAYGELLGMFAQYEAAQTPDMAAVVADIGTDAQQRIGRVSVWAKANLSGDEYAAFRAAMSDRNAATVFKAVEAVVSRVRQPAMPKPGGDGGAVPPSGLDGIRGMYRKLGPDGKPLFETDAEYRRTVEQKLTEFYQSQAS